MQRLITAILLTSLIGCGTSEAEIQSVEPAEGTLNLPVAAAAADAVLFQSSPRGNQIRQTDAGSLNTPGLLAIGNGKIFIADQTNRRVVGYSDPSTIMNGADADLVIGQEDMVTVFPQPRFVPNGTSAPFVNERIVPAGVAVDGDNRVYVFNNTDVNVYEDPFTTDALADYELNGLPATVRQVRAFGDRIAVVGASEIRYYPIGDTEPFAQGSIGAGFIPSPCAGQVYDVAETGNYILVACGDGVACYPNAECCTLPGGQGICPNEPAPDTTGVCACNPVTGMMNCCCAAGGLPPCATGDPANGICGNTFDCSGVYVYEKDAVSGFARPTPTAMAPAYPGLAFVWRNPNMGPPLGVVDGPLLIEVVSGNLLVLDRDQNRVIRFNNVETSHIPNSIGTTPPPAMTDADIDAIYGQSNAPLDPGAFGANWHPTTPGIVSENGLSLPVGFALDANNALWISDQNNSRILRYPDAAGASPTVVADRVLGQSNFGLFDGNRLEAGSLAEVGGLAIDPMTRRFFAADPASNRVMIFNDIDSLVSGAPGNGYLGQPDELSSIFNYVLGGPNGTPSSSGLANPRYVAVDPASRFVYVTDSSNRRIVRYENLMSSQTTDAVMRGIGVDTTNISPLTAGPNHPFHYRHLAVLNGQLFVAAALGPPPLAAHRIFRYDVSGGMGSPHLDGCPAQVFGQDPDDTAPIVIGGAMCPAGTRHLVNRTGAVGVVRPDGFDTVSGIALEADTVGSGSPITRLWVADSNNNRIVWFDDPVTAPAVEAARADGVVGQRNLVSRTNFGASRFSFQNNFGVVPAIGDIAVDSQGRLWVANTDGNRVMLFPEPRVADPAANAILGGAGAKSTVVLGQPNFTSITANNGPNGISDQTLSGPRSLAVNDTGTILAVGDYGNFRILRFTDNAAPVIGGGGTFEVAEGSSRTVPFTITDPEMDPVSQLTIFSEWVPAGTVMLSGNSLTYAATGARPGTIARVTVTAQDQGVRPQWGSASAIFVVVEAEGAPAGAGDREPRPAGEPDDSCRCSGTVASPLAWLLLVGLVRRRRSRRTL